MTELKRTPLYKSAIKSGGKMVPFSGWEMAVQFEGLIKEHKTVRESCGMFDISHMGSLRLIGENVKGKLQYLVPTDLSRLTVGKACYSVLMNDKGGIRDDLIIYDRGDNEVVLVINAACLESDTEWIRSQLEPDIEVIDYKNNGGWVHRSQLKKNKSLITLQEKILFKSSTKYSTPIAVIKSGRLLIVKKEEKKWLKVETGNYVGWIDNEYLWGN